VLAEDRLGIVLPKCANTRSGTPHLPATPIPTHARMDGILKSPYGIRSFPELRGAPAGLHPLAGGRRSWHRSTTEGHHPVPPAASRGNCPQGTVEVESGGKELRDRPVLQEALTLCRKHKAALLVQKVDRITRDMEVLARVVKDPQVTLKVASLPNADNFQIHLFGCLAAQEREFISTRTKAALAECKARGIRLGNPRLAELNRTRKQQARQFADQHSNLLQSLRNNGRTLREICDVLNDAGMKTAQGSMFHPVQVHRILKRSS